MEVTLSNITVEITLSKGYDGSCDASLGGKYGYQ